MPVVARNLRILSGSLHVCTLSATLMVSCLLLTGTVGICQDQPAPASDTPAATTDPAAPATDTRATDPPASDTPPATPVEGAVGCLPEITAQQKLTRSIRDIRNPLTGPSKSDADKLKRSYTQLLAAGFSSPADTKIVQDYLTWQIFQATDPEFSASSRNMVNLLTDVKDDISRAASGIGNPANQVVARRKYCAEVLKVTQQLLENNLDSRLAAVQINQSLYDVMGVQNGARSQLHADAMTSLLAILNDPQQPDSVKVATANGLHNVLVNCDVVVQDQYRICDAVAKELARPCTEPAFQMVLLDTLFSITSPRRTIGAPEPTVTRIFAGVVNDRTKPVEVRCHAAYGIGHGVFDQQMKLDPLAWKISQLAGDVAIEYSRAPGDAKWQQCGVDLLLAFRHNTQAQATAAILDRKGLMNRDEKSTTISGAAPFITSVAFKLIENKTPFSRQELTPLAQWIQTNQPGNLVWDQNSPPITP